MQDFNTPQKSGRGSSGLETLGIMPEPKRSNISCKNETSLINEFAAFWSFASFKDYNAQKIFMDIIYIAFQCLGFGVAIVGAIVWSLSPACLVAKVSIIT
jgi:hypothetical protein